MLNRLSHTQLLRYAGLFTWAVLGVPVFVVLYLEGTIGAHGAAPRALVAFSAYLAFGLIYWKVTHSLGFRQQRPVDLLLLAALTISAILISAETGTGLAAILMMVIAGVIPWLVTIRVGVVWLVLQHAALIPVFNRMEGFTPGLAVLQALTYVGYSSFAMVIGLVARQQAQAREEQRRLNAELRATRALLAESSRMRERVRISRELHDLLGHQLTILTLELEAARHRDADTARTHVERAGQLARTVLADVRDTVGVLRTGSATDLAEALRDVGRDVPGLDVTVEVGADVEADEEQTAALVRAVQEIVTNTLRHGAACRLAVTIVRDGDAIRLAAVDDGRGARDVVPGNGLRGIAERFAPLGGEIAYDGSAGFRVTARLPAR